jgi:hypothetical protein
VTELNQNGSVAGTFPGRPRPGAVALDSRDVWVANIGGGTLSKLRAA